MARALIVGCGCRGRSLGGRLLGDGWTIRGTTRRESEIPLIEAVGIEAVIADPDRPATIMDHVSDVTAIYWLMGTIQDEPEVVAAIHGPRLERLLEKLVDTPVRRFIYEAAGSVQDSRLAAGREVVEAAARTWRIPVACLTEDPAAYETWLEQAAAAATGSIG